MLLVTLTYSSYPSTTDQLVTAIKWWTCVQSCRKKPSHASNCMSEHRSIISSHQLISSTWLVWSSKINQQHTVGTETDWKIVFSFDECMINVLCRHCSEDRAHAWVGARRTTEAASSSSSSFSSSSSRAPLASVFAPPPAPPAPPPPAPPPPYTHKYVLQCS